MRFAVDNFAAWLDQYLERLERCLMGSRSPQERSPLILVLGCGGTEERCLSIIRHFHAREQKLAEFRAAHQTQTPRLRELAQLDNDPSPLVIWVYFEPKAPPTLWNCLMSEERQQSQMLLDDSPQEKLLSALRKANIWTMHARNPGFFLMHLHSYLTTRHPASRVQYLAHIDRPIGLTKRGEVSPTASLVKE